MDSFTEMAYYDQYELYDKLRALTQPVGLDLDLEYKEFNNIVRTTALNKTILKYLQFMLSHEFYSIDPKFDPSVLCEDPKKWETIITMLKHRADNSSTLSKRNR